VLSLSPSNGSIPLQRNLVIPAEYDSPFAGTIISAAISGTRLRVGTSLGNLGTSQHQYQIVDGLIWSVRKHSFKVGWDWRRLTPRITAYTYESHINVTAPSDIQDGNATTVQITASAPGQPVFDNVSLYAQDDWKIGTRLSFDYGLRWEFNPPPGSSNGHYPVALSSDNLSTATLAPIGTAPFEDNLHSFAPRIGFAWSATPSVKHPITVRGGFGIFFDSNQNVIGNAYNGVYPFGASGSISHEVPLPLSGAALTPPSLNLPPPTPPYPQVYISDPDLTLPYTEQWNLSIDEALSAKNIVTVSYVGNNGRKLLSQQYYGAAPKGNQAFPQGLAYTTNVGQSSYNALQVQDRGRVTNGLDLVASFTLAHALDNASNEAASFAPVWGN